MRLLRLAIPIFFFFVSSLALGANQYFPDFSDTTGLTINGNAVATPTGDGVVLRLTPDEDWRRGSFFTTEQVSVEKFSTHFAFRLSSPEASTGDCNDYYTNGGGDGLTFAIQSQANTALGGMGCDLGFGSISPSVAVEFDSWCNRDQELNEDYWDPEPVPEGQTHVGIDLNGSTKISVATAEVDPDLNAGGGLWYAWVDYDGTTLEVRISPSDSRPAHPLLTYDVDLVSEVGELAYVGFTGSTGGNHQNTDILSWYLWNYELFISTVPTLGSWRMILLTLLLVGAGAMTVLRRRQVAA